MKKIAFLAMFAVFLCTGYFVVAADIDIQLAESSISVPEYSIRLDTATIAKGYTVSAFANSLKLSLVPGILDEATQVRVLDLSEEKMPVPWNMDLISNVYQFEFVNKAAYDDHKPFYIQFSYTQNSNNHKSVYFYDKGQNTWRPLPTTDFPNEKFVRSLIHLPFARIAVLANSDFMTVGRASWYAHKGGDFAASPDFPKGSRLRVYNTDNNKFVDVTVNDYGPERSLHPDRVVDLDKIAFTKLAPLSAGVINVRVESLDTQIPIHQEVLGVAISASENEPKIGAKSAVVIREDTGEILFFKKATSTMPIASLSKIIAIKVYLDTKPSLNQVVEYRYQDEEYNYQWVKKWESARLRVKETETMTVEDLLYSALVGSANNAVESLVRASGLAREDFIAKMNSYAYGFGAVNTHFEEPTGLSPQNVSTALEYAIISREAWRHPIIAKSSSMSVYKFSTINTKDPHTIHNSNQLVNMNQFKILGSKTGFLNESGHCLATLVDMGEYSIITVVLGDDSKLQARNDTEDLVKYVQRKKIKDKK